MDEQDEEIDVMEFLQSKGVSLDPFKREYMDVQKSIETMQTNNSIKEREMDSKSSELKVIREQLAYTRRNVDELISQQEVLKETIDNANNRKEHLQDREDKNRQEIQILNTTFSELKEALTIGSDWSPEQLEQKQSWEKQRDYMVNKLENKSNALTALRGDIDMKYQDIETLEKEIADLDDKLTDVNNQKNALKRQVATNLDQKEATEKEIFDLRKQYIDKESELLEKQKLYKMEEKDMKLLDKHITKSKQRMEIYIKEYETLVGHLSSMSLELEKCNTNNKKNAEEIEEREEYMAKKAEELMKLQKAVNQQQGLRDLVQQKCTETEQSKHQNEQNIEQLTKNINEMRNSTMLSMHRELETLEKQESKNKQEMEILRKKMTNTEKSAKTISDLIILNKNTKLNLHIEYKLYQEEIDMTNYTIRNLLIEKDKYEHDIELYNQQYYTSLEEMKLQEIQINELNKKIISDQMKLKQKQSLYENVRSDRNLFSKQLMDITNEIMTLKKSFRGMNHLIDNMKEDISLKDHAIVKEHFLHHSVDKERELLKNEITKIRKQVQASEGIIENQRIEIMKLQRIIDEAEQERQRQRNELSSILSERNLLTGQLVKRNEELNIMYDKIKIQRSDLLIGERNYEKLRLAAVDCHTKITSLVMTNNDTIIALQDYELLKNQKISLEKYILKEQTRIRALDEELEIPMNIHRWRILESSDPKRFDKILQIQNLSKLLVSMSDKIITFDLSIQEKEKIYIELKNIISRHPGPEVEEQILVYQQTLKEKNKQYIAMSQELEMYIEQVKRFQEEIGEYDYQLGKLNKQWVKMTKKMRESNTNNNNTMSNTMGNMMGSPTGTGNGMNLSASMNGLNF